MKTKKKKFLFLLIFTLAYNFLYASDNFFIKFKDITEYKIDNNKLFYRISSKYKYMNYSKLKNSFLFYNKENQVKENLFYSDGFLKSKDIKIKFSKAYFYEGNFIMLNSQGSYKNTQFIAKKTIFIFSKLSFENVFLQINDKKYKKLKYTINL